MAYKKTLRKKQNPTTEVVRAAMKETAKDVRAPKVVRDGIVKPKKKKIEIPVPSPKINIAAKSAIDYIILDDSIKLKAKHIKNTPTFSQTRDAIQIPSIGDEEFGNVRYVAGRMTCGDVEIEIEVKDKKMLKIMNLFHAMRRISFTMANQNGLKIVSTGFLKAINESIDGVVSLTYCPNEFSIL
jgi:hypothetical protein